MNSYLCLFPLLPTSKHSSARGHLPNKCRPPDRMWSKCGNSAFWGETHWFCFSLPKQSIFTLFSPSQEIISILVAVILPALLSQQQQLARLDCIHISCGILVWLRRKKREEDQEYNSNYHVFFLSLVLVLGIMAGLRTYAKESNRSGGRKCGKGMRLRSPSKWCMSYIYIQTYKYKHTNKYVYISI